MRSSRIIYVYVCLALLGQLSGDLLAQQQPSPSAVEPPRSVVQAGKPQTQPKRTLSGDQIDLPATLDTDLEHLLSRWYTGYGRRATSTGALRAKSHIPDVPDSVYMDMLDKIPSAMRMSYNPLVRECIELYLFRRRSLLSSVLSLADLYFPEIETTLEKHQLPLELKYLTIVESSLNPTAISPMGAAGLWQLMLPTARVYGLQINSLVDERLDPTRSTEAACKLLGDLHRIYGDWWLALAAYNCGPGNVNRAIKRTGLPPPSFWDIYPNLPRETRRYVPLFIGAYFAMYYHQHYGIEPKATGQPLATELYTVRDQITTKHLANLSGATEEQIRALNPQFRRGIIPGNVQPYEVRLPLSAVLALESISPDSVRTEELAVEEVAPRGTEPAKGKGKKGKTAATSSRQYKVKKGDTLGAIAQRHGVTVAQLRRWNGIKGSNLRIGQRLIVSAP